MKASVKVMRSYDYSHFEVALSSDEDMTLDQIDDMRKEAARLVDKAIKQYKIAKNHDMYREDEQLAREAKVIKENYPKSEWTPEQKATIKRHDDNVFYASRPYDYEDQWDCDY